MLHKWTIFLESLIDITWVTSICSSCPISLQKIFFPLSFDSLFAGSTRISLGTTSSSSFALFYYFCYLWWIIPSVWWRLGSYRCGNNFLTDAFVETWTIYLVWTIVQSVGWNASLFYNLVWWPFLLDRSFCIHLLFPRIVSFIQLVLQQSFELLCISALILCQIIAGYLVLVILLIEPMVIFESTLIR